MSDTVISHDSETPANGQQVFTACAFIHHNFGGKPKVFLAKRAATKKFFPDVYELPGGHIDYGETMEGGLRREIHEELHKAVVIGDPFAAFTYLNPIKGSHSIEVIYFAQFAGAIDDIQLNPEDHSECGWFAEDEIERLLGEHTDELPFVKKGFALLGGARPQF
ncbi:MAG TPA: NUDIX hydrolase [Candidatus Saccharimonadales bacterium]|nr:NUDIX hydrolase [Candidatus Saccharimonadales bacterium]